MKKFALILGALLVLMSASAVAELTVVTHGYFVTAYDADSYVTFVAEVRNDGDTPIVVEDSAYEISGADDLVASEGFFFGSYPYIIAPGASAYVIQNDYFEAVSPEAISDITFEFIPGAAYSDVAPEIPVSGATYQQIFTEWGETLGEVVVTVFNDADESVRDYTATYGLYDQNGGLLMAGSTMNYNVGIPAGQMGETIFYIEQDLLEVWEEAGLVPTTVKAMAYIE